ncbi:hypothetical protein [Streptomyces corynorhini]|uniref:Uncharacterized protein n=1 Tax=Streptomyces corynorhini TaxID=2282652 RepID=A0A370BEP3_9ACTN|nr:hypothetical protein DVH02_06945 [Streptomyces corynorhini]
MSRCAAPYGWPGWSSWPDHRVAIAGAAGRPGGQDVRLDHAARSAAYRPPAAVTEDSVREIFGMACRIVPDEVSGTPPVLPIGRHHATRDTAGGG